MSLSDLADLGEFFSSLAVLVSLAYLAVQIRQADRNQRSALVQQRTAARVEGLFHCAEPHLAPVLLKANSDPANLSDLELSQLFQAYSALWNWFADAYYHHESKLMSGLAFDSLIAEMRPILARPAARAFWAMSRDAYAPAFADFIDEQMKAVPMVSRANRSERWKAELAKLAPA